MFHLGKILYMLGVFYLIPGSKCANILFYIGFGGPSHRIAMEPLANSLIAKDHKVTFLLQEKPATIQYPKTKYFVSEKVEEFFESLQKGENAINLYETRKRGTVGLSWFLVPWFGVKVCENLYRDPMFLEWISNEKFDLIVVDGLYSECAYGIAHLHKAKIIIFFVSSVPPWIIDAVGIPDESASVPDMQFHFPQNMKFWQRMINAVTPVFWRMYREWYHFPQLEKITREGLASLKPQTVPSFKELEDQVDLVFVNTHPAQEYPRSLPPNVIPIGGISYSGNKKPLPQELQDFIDRGKNGFVYVNFGSYLDFSMFPEEVQSTFLHALGNFSNIQFVWKMRTKPDQLPENIYVQKWLPQQDILGHPNIKVFITHSGLGGVNEAIYGAVPLLCFPVFAEQDANANLVVSKGIGLKMEITTVTENGLSATLGELLSNNNAFRENMMRVRKQFLDRPISAIETATWFTEYVIRENLQFRKPLKTSWYVKRQLDVWLVIALAITIASSLFTYLVWTSTKYLYENIVRCIFRRKSQRTVRFRMKPCYSKKLK